MDPLFNDFVLNELGLNRYIQSPMEHFKFQGAGSPNSYSWAKFLPLPCRQAEKPPCPSTAYH
jgi:hypothetical protein